MLYHYYISIILYYIYIVVYMYITTLLYYTRQVQCCIEFNSETRNGFGTAEVHITENTDKTSRLVGQDKSKLSLSHFSSKSQCFGKLRVGQNHWKAMFIPHQKGIKNTVATGRDFTSHRQNSAAYGEKVHEQISQALTRSSPSTAVLTTYNL